LTRLLDEQCEVVKEAPAPKADDADVNDTPAPVVVKPAKEVRSDSLQTPHDQRSRTRAGRARARRSRSRRPVATKTSRRS
jgi:hypothetical protein